MNNLHVTELSTSDLRNLSNAEYKAFFLQNPSFIENPVIETVDYTAPRLVS